MFLLTRINFINFSLRLGVSICLDVISIEISISTPKKYQSRRSRKSRRFSKVSLDNREISVEIEISRFSLDEVSQDRIFQSRSRFFETNRDLSRLVEIFVIICGFLEYFSISTEKYWIFTNISIEILVPNLICLHFVLQNWLQNGQKVWEIQIFFKKSRQNLDLSRQNLDLSRQNLDY